VNNPERMRRAKAPLETPLEARLHTAADGRVHSAARSDEPSRSAKGVAVHRAYAAERKRGAARGRQARALRPAMRPTSLGAA